MAGTELRRFTIFLTVGSATALLYFSLLALLLDGLKFDYRICVSAAYGCAVVFHFTMNRRITFRSVEERAFPQAGRYAIMALTSYLITLAIVSYVVETLRLSPYAGVLVALVVTTVFGYCVSKMWVFRRRDCRNE